MTPKLKLAADALYVPTRVAEEESALRVSFPDPDDTLGEGLKKYVRTMTCVGVLYHFDKLSSNQTRAWTNALDECLRREPVSMAYEDVMKDLRKASRQSSAINVHRAFGSSINASAFSLDKLVRDELVGAKNPGEEGTRAYAMKILEEGIANHAIPSKLRQNFVEFVETQFESDDRGMEV